MSNKQNLLTISPTRRNQSKIQESPSKPKSHPCSSTDNICQRCKTQGSISGNSIEQMRVMISDYQFQIKRLIEDSATFKTLTEIDRGKFVKEYQQKITALKRQIEEDNLSWIARFNVRDQEYNRNIQNLKVGLEQEKNQLERRIKVEMAQKVKRVEQEKMSAISEIQKLANQKTSELASKHKSTVQAMQNGHAEELKKLHQSHIAQLSKRQREYENMILGVTSEKKCEEQLHQKTKEQLTRVKQSLYDEIYQLRRTQTKLQNVISQLRKDKKSLEQQVVTLKQNIMDLEEQYRSQIQNLQEKSARQMLRAKEQSKKELTQILQRQLQKTDKLNLSLKQLEERHEQQKQLFNSKVNQMNQCYSDRPSRPEDLKTIQELQDMLVQKQSEFQMIAQELKWNRLELENKEEVYTKIFTNGETRLDLLNRPSGDRQQQQGSKEFKFRRVGKSLKLGSGKIVPTPPASSTFKLL